MEYLPPAEERDWLLSRLARLIARRGHDTFLSAALLEPTPACFPDPWEPTAAGVERLARRILRYAGLAELGAHVALFTNHDDVRALDGHGRPSAWGHSGAAAWFAGIESRVCLFGADAGQLDTPDALVGVMCHEVAHAYRQHHRLIVEDRETEERLTDLTTVYLGFGVLTTNSAYRYRASGGLEGAGGVTRWSHSSTGYLTPQAMSYLLGAQLVARRGPAPQRRRVRRLLEPNQRAFFRAACAEHDRAGLALPLQLGLRGDAWLARPSPWWRRLFDR